MKLTWDNVGERYFETGVDHGVHYMLDENNQYASGVAWNGLTAVNESPSGAEANGLFADNIKYLNLVSNETYAATIEAYSYPDQFAECDGSAQIAKGIRIGQQRRKMFGFSYRTRKGNDTEGDAYGYIIHLVYGCQAAPSARNHTTVNDSPDAVAMSWEINTTPVNVTGFRPTATVEIDSTTTDAAKLTELEGILYGSADVEPRMPFPDEIITLVGTSSVGL